MRTAAQHTLRANDAKLPHAGEVEIWLRAATVRDVGRVNGPRQAFYRIHVNGVQRTTYAGHVVDLEGRLAALRKLLVGPEARIASGDARLDRGLGLTARRVTENMAWRARWRRWRGAGV